MSPQRGTNVSRILEKSQTSANLIFIATNFFEVNP